MFLETRDKNYIPDVYGFLLYGQMPLKNKKRGSDIIIDRVKK